MTISTLMVELFFSLIDAMDLQQQQQQQHTDLQDIFTERTVWGAFPPGHECSWSRSSVKEERHENQKHF